ncbi:MAG TPA: hypothetical protein VJG49_03930 [Candidatus Nanoarchaeia archaeon]|nr:hypothetical protein [Candidatus Nanoarchaeia archaeon]
MRNNHYQNSPEYRMYKLSEIWLPLKKVPPAADLIRTKNKLIFYLYKKIKQEYQQFPRRKNGEDPFLHPLNTFYYLQKAGVEDTITLAAGLLHDYIEEKVDLYKRQNHLAEDVKSIRILNDYESKLLAELEQELQQVCKANRLDPVLVKKITAIVSILTRNKRHLYYRSISEIFNCKDEKTKERTIQIKLADRMHNIQTLSSYNEEGKIYQCFKNMFILNNTKMYLLNLKEKKKKRDLYSLEKLFKKCCKATYEAFLDVCHQSLIHKISRIKTVLHLALKKFAFESGGLWAVTTINVDETHPMRLFRGIIRKYDARLHLEFDRFKKMENSEIDYCRKFFADFNFSDAELQSLIYYKDAYALKEVVARLLYKPKYVISRFGCSELCTRGQICMHYQK